ncbi:MAG: sigma factor-like helix-turn-helix DNA-binding protein [Candidatus Curtissbacteria bacterium]
MSEGETTRPHLDEHRASGVLARFDALVDPIPEELVEPVAQAYRRLFTEVYRGFDGSTEVVVHVDTPEELAAMQREVHSLFSVNTQRLNPRSGAMIAQLYGFLDGKRKTADETGKIFGVTGSRVGQIRSRAVKVLRHPTIYGKIAPTFVKIKHLGQGGLTKN